MLLLGLGLGMVMQVLVIAAQNAVDYSAAAGGAGMNPRAILLLPPATRQLYAAAFTQSLATVFLVATSIAVVGFLLALVLPIGRFAQRSLRAPGTSVQRWVRPSRCQRTRILSR